MHQMYSYLLFFRLWYQNVSVLFSQIVVSDGRAFQELSFAMAGLQNLMDFIIFFPDSVSDFFKMRISQSLLCLSPANFKLFKNA